MHCRLHGPDIQSHHQPAALFYSGGNHTVSRPEIRALFLLSVFEQIYTGCLAEAAYYIESNGEAAIIDPLRETKPYTDKAEKNGAVIKYILETHFHADFVSGHQELSAKTGATIVFGPTAAPGYEAHV